MTRALAQGRAGDTIFALASGAGRAAISVLRLSGERTGAIVGALAGKLPQPRFAALRNLCDSDKNILDRALILWLPAPASYTGEDMVELHLHGGRAVLVAVTNSLLNFGARPADPGEFTRRAFLAGKMDFLEAEAIADLVDAETEAQRRQALRQMQGAPSDLVGGLAERLKRCLAFQEALIDFPDDNLPEDVERSLLNDLVGIQAEISVQIDRAARAEKLRHGLVFAITGAPNVGKSSLLNALARRDVAIVSHLPGTTRDSIEVAVELGGVKVTLIDTAGLRDTQDPIEAEGIRRTLDRAASADLVLTLIEAGDTCMPHGVSKTFAVTTKIDLAAALPGTLGISTKSGEGLSALETSLAEQATRLTSAGAEPVLNRARHIAALRDTYAAVGAALSASLPELRGEDLRLAVRALGRVTGLVEVEDVLDEVFGAFCIGK